MLFKSLTFDLAFLQLLQAFVVIEAGTFLFFATCAAFSVFLSVAAEDTCGLELDVPGVSGVRFLLFELLELSLIVVSVLLGRRVRRLGADIVGINFDSRRTIDFCLKQGLRDV